MELCFRPIQPICLATDTFIGDDEELQMLQNEKPWRDNLIDFTIAGLYHNFIIPRVAVICSRVKTDG